MAKSSSPSAKLTSAGEPDNEMNLAVSGMERGFCWVEFCAIEVLTLLFEFFVECSRVDLDLITEICSGNQVI
jgi:hypothetical protein